MDGDVSQGASRGPSPTYEERYATRLTSPISYPALPIRLDWILFIRNYYNFDP